MKEYDVFGNEIIEDGELTPQSNYYNRPDIIRNHQQYEYYSQLLPNVVKAVGRKEVRYIIDGSPLIDDTCSQFGECLEYLNRADKLQLMGAIAETLY